MLLRALALSLIAGLPAAAQDTAVGFGTGDFDAGAPVEVSAESLEIDQATGRATLTGDVVIAQGELRLSADVVTVDYSTDGATDGATSGGTRSIERLNARGNVIIVAGEDAAEGQEAVYTLGTSDIRLSGDVVVTQGGNTLAGDALSINLESGGGTVTGRVRTTLQP